MESRIRLLPVKSIILCCEFIIMLFVIIGTGKICLAGEVNSDEARVLGVARGTFEYDGEIYIANQEYVDQLIAKMSSDDVDLTAEQADEAINRIYANVETGVKEGYIVKVNPNSESSDGNDKNNESGNSGDKGDGNGEQEKDSPKEELTVKENNNGTITVEDSKGNVKLAFDGVLKNTGFSIQNTITILIIIGVVLLCVVVYSVKNILVMRNK